MHWLQAELSNIFSTLTGEEVRLTPEETLQVLLVVRRTTRQQPQMVSNSI
ncbi:MAG: hypothetical protein O2954_12490 [bacterium]|nr:hypothetical protein [bacterium]